MTELAYLAFVFSACVFGALLGGAAPCWRAHAGYVPEDLGPGERANAFTREGDLFERHIIGAEWEDAGYRDGGSIRNPVYYVLWGAAAPLLAGLVLWGEREAVVAALWAGLSTLGLDPPPCR